VVPLNLQALAVLERQQGQCPRYVFTYRDNAAGRASTRVWHTALEKAGIENYRLHDLKTYLSILTCAKWNTPLLYNSKEMTQSF